MKDDLRRKSEEIADYCSEIVDSTGNHTEKLLPEIEAFGIACMKAAFEEAEEIADNYDCSSRFEVITPIGKAANKAARDIVYDIRQRAKDLL